LAEPPDARTPRIWSLSWATPVAALFTSTTAVSSSARACDHWVETAA
jgi:hypothetical protein